MNFPREHVRKWVIQYGDFFYLFRGCQNVLASLSWYSTIVLIFIIIIITIIFYQQLSLFVEPLIYHWALARKPLKWLWKILQKMVAPNYLRQPIRVTRSSESLISDIFRDWKCNSIVWLSLALDVIFINEEGTDARGSTREYCHMVMASLCDGLGGLALLEGKVDNIELFQMQGKW